MPTTLAGRSAPAISPTANDVEGRLLIEPAGGSQNRQSTPLS